MELIPGWRSDEHKVAEEVGPFNGSNATYHAGHGVAKKDDAVEVHLLDERDEIIGEGSEGGVLGQLQGLAGVVGGRTGKVPVEEQDLIRLWQVGHHVVPNRLAPTVAMCENHSLLSIPYDPCVPVHGKRRDDDDDDDGRGCVVPFIGVGDFISSKWESEAVG